MDKTDVGVLEPEAIQSKIFTIRGVQVMIDRDLADEVVANCDHLSNLRFSYRLPYAFSEQGVAMLSTVLKSKMAVKISIQIIDSFVAMRRFLHENAAIFQRLDTLERKQLETDGKFNQVFDALQQADIAPKQGIFYDGQVFDAYTFIDDIIRKASTSIILIDNYVDDTVLSLFTKRKKGVSVTIYTKTIAKTLALDLDKHNAQYTRISVRKFEASHDRFPILDESIVYHIGASLKDLGKKWFAFSKMDARDLRILERLGNIIRKPLSWTR